MQFSDCLTRPDTKIISQRSSKVSGRESLTPSQQRSSANSNKGPSRVTLSLQSGVEASRRTFVRFTPGQQAVLEQAYLQNANWSREHTQRLAAQLGLSYRKVYKWLWGRNKKELSS